MNIIAAAQILVLILVVLVIGIGIWANIAKPPKSIVSKYSRKALILATVPFLRNWNSHINAPDIAVFAEYRRRMLILYAAIFVAFAMIGLVKQLIIQSIINSV